MKRLESLLSRKFIFAIIAIICGFYLTVIGKTDAKAFFSFVEIIGGIYVIGNVTGSVTNGIAEKIGERFNP